MTRALLGWLTVGLGLCFAPSAFAGSAQPGEPGFSDRPLSIEVRTGLSTSVGLLGVVAELTPLDRITLGGGIGNNGLGRIWGAHLRARPLLFRDKHGVLGALTLEGAFSRGRYEGFDFDALASLMCEDDPSDPKGSCYSPGIVPVTMSWGQLEFGGELRFPFGISLRGSFGVARALESPNWQCVVRDVPAPCGDFRPANWLPVLTFAVGYAF